MKTLGMQALILRWRAQQLFKSEEGATAVEYGLLVALIAAVIVVIVGTLGGQVNTAFTSISSQL